MGIAITGNDVVRYSSMQDMDEGQQVQSNDNSSAVRSSGSDMKPHSAGSTPDGNSTAIGLDHHQLDKLNETLGSAQYSVQFDTAEGSGHYWLNVVDKSTGEIIYEIPAENVRKWVESYSSGHVSGLAVNLVR